MIPLFSSKNCSAVSRHMHGKSSSIDANLDGCRFRNHLSLEENQTGVQHPTCLNEPNSLLVSAIKLHLGGKAMFTFFSFQNRGLVTGYLPKNREYLKNRLSGVALVFDYMT